MLIIRLRLLTLVLSVLSLSLIAAAQDQKAGDDEKAVRAIAEHYFAAYASKAPAQLMSFWSARSPSFESRKREIEKLFTVAGVADVRNLELGKLKVNEGVAVVRVNVEVICIDEKTGKPATGFGKWRRTLRLTREVGSWRVWSELEPEVDLAGELIAAKSEEERSSLLEAEKDLINTALRTALTAKGIRFLYELGDYAQEALTAMKTALRVAEQLGDQEVVAKGLVNLGAVYQRQNDNARALQLYQQSLALAEKIGSKVVAAGALTSMSKSYLDQNEYDQALASLQRSLVLNEKSANTLLDIGYIHKARGNNLRAMEYYQRALAQFEADGDENGIAVALQNIGRIYEDQRNSAQALNYYQQELKLKEKSTRRGATADTLINLGNLYFIQGNLVQALESYHKALTGFQANGDKGGISAALGNIATIAKEKGDYAQALEFHQKALQVVEEAKLVNLIDSRLLDLAQDYVAQGDYPRALEFTNRAGALARSAGRIAVAARALALSGHVYRLQGQFTKSREALSETIALIETLRKGIAGGEEEVQRAFENMVSPYYEMAELLSSAGKFDEAVAFAEQTKARVILDVLRTGKVEVTKAMTAAEIEQERKLRVELVSLNKRLTDENGRGQPNQTRVAELDSRLKEARLGYERFQTNLLVAHPGLNTQRGQVQPIKLEEAKDLLRDPKAALLEYLVADDQVILFVLTKTSAQKTPPVIVKAYSIKIKKRDLEKRVERYRELLAKRDPDFQSTARELFDLLLGPAQEQLRDRTTFAIIPDGVLWEMPFQALQPSRQRYLIEDHAISYAPSLTALREMTKEHRKTTNESAANSTLLAFGNPLTGTKTEELAKKVLMDESLEPLPEAEKQVAELERLYGPKRSRVYTGAEATEERVKAEAPFYRVVQFATHGVLNSASPMYSYLVLSQGARDDNEDGLLEAWEIMKLDLHADLVVLAACETARGRVGAGEGMIGMSWAFFVAGSPTTVASQWKVESASTTQLMIEFHRNLKLRIQNPSAQISKARALQLASLKLLKSREYQHPFYWAGFVLIGDGF